MAKGQRYYWIKLKESFLFSDTVDYFMSQKNGANYVVLYQMLCLKTINTNGRLSRQIGEVIIPYDVDKIHRDCKWFSTEIICKALELYKSFGLVYEDKDGVLVLAEHQELVGSETDYAKQKNKQRKEANVTLRGGQCPPKCPPNVQEIVHTEIRDKDIRDKDIRDKRLEIREEISSACPVSEILTLYNTVCVSLPKAESMSDDTKALLLSAWQKYGAVKAFKDLFEMAEENDFLTGREGNKWKADFDWLVNPNNMTKVLNHKYESFKTKNNDEEGEYISGDQPQQSKLTGVLAAIESLREVEDNDQE